MSDLDEVIEEFLVESHENLDRLDNAFVQLEESPSDPEILGAIFRTMHTIKGLCGMLGFSKLESITHSGETLLSRLREGQLQLDQEITNALLATVDAVRDVLTMVEEGGSEGESDYSTLVATLQRLASGESAAGLGEPDRQEDATGVSEFAEAGLEEEETFEAGEASSPDLRDPTPTEPVKGSAEAEGGALASPRRRSVAESSIRVDVGLLNKLMNLVGELVLARNQVLQHMVSQEDPVFQATSQRLNLITTELQEEVMKTRMQPIGNVWSKFPRVVRDLAVSCGKKVRVEMEGRETELDRTIIEAIKDPLTHLVRNSVDHGIEEPRDRISSGKKEEGRLSLRAFHEGGQVNIEVSDDGGGLNLDRIRDKAVSRRLVSVDQVESMSDREIGNLIFLPGFSTAQKVSNVSGRGVGMDVVKTNIEKIGGTVDIQTASGEGSTIRIKIPLTLAIIPALVVTSGGDRFSIPQVNLLELVRLEPGSEGLEMLRGSPVYRLRGRLLPLVSLNDILGLVSHQDLASHQDGVENDESREHGERALNIVVLQADDRQFGLVVDEINDTEEIVVKPLGTHLKNISAFAGATIMGDGKVALILDVLGIAQESGVASGQVHAASVGDPSEAAHGQRIAENHETLLLFQVGGQERMAIPLALVDRLEEFSWNDVERSGPLPVVQYRDGILPLFLLREYLGGCESRTEESETLQVVVLSTGDRWLGIVVDQIVDVLEESFNIERRTRRRGVMGSAVIQDRVTDLLNVEEVVAQLDPEFRPAPRQDERALIGGGV